MAVQAINLTDSDYLYTQYSWYNNIFPPVIQRSSDEFFLEGLQFALIGISKNITPLMDKESYFVTKVRLDQQHDLFFRSSEKAVEVILDKVLGKAQKRFNINKMTDLEAKVITAFNDYLYHSVSQVIEKPGPTIKRMNFDVIHLTFIVKNIDESKAAKFIVSLPEVLLQPESVTSTGDKFSRDNFLRHKIDVTIQAGTTKFSVYDLKHLEAGDVVVFDNSRTDRMILKLNDYKKEINLKPNMGLVIPIEGGSGGNNMDETNIWDSIQVEMTAQFDITKISLGDLKAIEAGEVVDIASIYDNTVTLVVDNKSVAKGELVIVNDKYGVKVNEVMAIGEDEPDMFEDFGAGGNAAPTASAPAAKAADTDDFDYSDFELDDI